MKKVVIVEDCADLRELYSIALAKEAYSVEIFPDGKSVTQHFVLGHSADLLVCDIGLPGMPGDELIQLFRTLNRKSKAKVIIASGVDELAKLSQSLGADAYLKKPIPLGTLRKAILEELSTPAMA